MIVRFRSLVGHMMSHLLLFSLSFDFHHLPHMLFYIISHFIVINMPVGYSPSKIRDKSSNPSQPDISSRLVDLDPSQVSWFLSSFQRGLVPSFVFLLGIFHVETFYCSFLFGSHCSWAYPCCLLLLLILAASAPPPQHFRLADRFPPPNAGCRGGAT